MDSREWKYKLANPYVLGICYWLIWLFLLSSFQPFGNAAWAASVNVAAQGITAFATICFLIPHYLEKRKYLAYAAQVAILIFLLTVLYMKLTEPGLHLLAGKREIRYPRAFQFGRMYFFLFVIHIVSTAYKFASDRFYALQRQSELHRKQLETELQVLKNQINPHFLFNTLNNVYTLAYLKDDNAAPMIMKLSELLRYTLYDCQADRVKLEKEVEFLRNIIAMQQLKSDVYQKRVSLETSGVQPNHFIAPLLLLVFIENSFKFSDLDTNPDGHIHISLRVDMSGTLHFECGNTTKQPLNEEPKAGIGLANVRKRLQLIYPENYELQVAEMEGEFLVSLKIFHL
ncbi:sensor histidine kinase [Dyadobacter aurulentus]|uniref:sensor histidine kinase n=1 Tax=Dyadobacter sp. UC 10 TaxID=2605428 RepID=UPI0011F3A868|nr:sensor histidine kinase [Dyadobacter sp. UC 10]KAA0992274.1 hypothetical protein FXO21_19875 [Dyadobacter sp. UC 10]